VVQELSGGSVISFSGTKKNKMTEHSATIESPPSPMVDGRVPEEVRLEVIRLIRKGRLSSYAIEKKTGVARRVIQKVRQGKLWKREWEMPVGRMLSQGKKHRCDRCGVMVYGECRECKVATLAERRMLLRRGGEELKRSSDDEVRLMLYDGGVACS